MSSILKALRKLEEEKARQDQGSVDIATDILRTSGRQTSRSWFLPLAVAALLLAGAGGGVYLSRSFFSVPEPAAPVAAETQPAPSQPVAVPLIPASELVPEVKSVTLSPPAEKPPAPEVPVVAAPEPVQSEPQAQFVPLDSGTTAEEGLQDLPKLIVSGIVYQDDPQNRMAVINDLPVMSGTTIEGVDVVEIQPDRVVFSFEGKSFSITMSDQ